MAWWRKEHGPDRTALLEEALDPATPPERLRALVRSLTNASGAEPCREAVARNPNAPLDVLFAVGASYPRAFLENPALPLLALEKPSFLGDALPALLEKLLSLAETPDWLVESARSAPAASLRMLLRVAEPAPLLLERLSHSSSPEVLAAVAAHPEALPAVLSRLAYHRDQKVRAAVARNPRTPAMERTLLTQDDDLVVRYLAKSPRGRIGKAFVRMKRSISRFWRPVDNVLWRLKRQLRQWRRAVRRRLW
jgi:hypothetical protein